MNDRAFQPHVTVAAVVESAGEFLVVREYVNGVERINNPAGHLEDGESIEAATRREVLEETGYHFEAEALGGVYVWRHPGGETFVRFNVIGHCPGRDPAAELDTGIIGPAWMTLEALEAASGMLRSPLVTRSFREYGDGIRYPLDAVASLIER